MTRTRQVAAIFVAAISFGVVVAVVKGQDTGVRDVLGNMSAPWVLIPFFAGACCRRIAPAALAGMAATQAAFLGFYLTEALVLDLGPHPLLTDLKLTLGSGHVYEQFGLLSGPVYGALGALWRSGSVRLAPVAVALAFIFEPLIVFVISHAGIWGGAELLSYAWLWVGEVLLGVAGLALILRTASVRR